jgi:hypothetical protein
MKRLIILLINIVFPLCVCSANLTDEYQTVDPPFLDLALSEGETAVEQVSLTIHPYCIRPFYVNVVASDPRLIVTNLSGVINNGCGGDTSTFDIEFSGSLEVQAFDLQFVDTMSDNVISSIPVTIYPKQENEQLIGIGFHKLGIVFQVMSSGCTQKSDFKLQIMESYPLQLRLIRIKPDPCDAYMPLGERIFYSYKELGIFPGDALRVNNPLGTVVVPH